MAAPYVVTVGAERCRERFVRVRRPMFHRLFLQGGAVVALPRPGTKTAGAVAFELGGGREIEIGTLPGGGPPGNGDRLRLDYLSSPVGRGPSQLRVFGESSSEPLRTLEMPDAISGVAEVPFGWYVGCRDGFLYALDRSGDLRWRWQTPGAAAFHAAGPGEVYFRPCPYRLASNGHSALVGCGRDGLSWPHYDGLIWPHPRPTAGRPSELQRARRGGRGRGGIEDGAFRADP